MMQLKTVVLPAPLGPMIEWIAPCLNLELEAVDGDQAAEALGHLLGPEQHGAGHERLLGDLGPLHRQRSRRRVSSSRRLAADGHRPSGLSRMTAMIARP